MSSEQEHLSLYFFDVDDNIVFLSTPIYILNVETGVEKKVSTGEFARIHPHLEQPGMWEDYRIFEGSFREFRDIAPDNLGPGEDQYFVRDIKTIVNDTSGAWKAPSWKFFVHACNAQRPLSFVTARGHSPDTIKAGVEQMKQAGLIKETPNYLSIYPVGNDEVRANQLDDPNLIKTTPRLKKIAIIKSVEKALELSGEPNSYPALEFKLARCLVMTGELERATRLLEELAQSGEHVWARAAKAKLEQVLVKGAWDETG